MTGDQAPVRNVGALGGGVGGGHLEAAFAVASDVRFAFIIIGT